MGLEPTTVFGVLIPVEIAEPQRPHAKEEGGELLVWLCSGRQIEVRGGFDAKVLEQLVRVLDDLGLPQAVANFLDSWSEHSGVPADFEASGLDQNRLPGELETVLYRVTQEALNNVAKHAEASNVAVLLHRNTSYVSLIIEDNGLGFDYNQHLITGENGLGLIGLRERVELTGGTLEIESRVGHGTTIAVRIPV